MAATEAPSQSPPPSPRRSPIRTWRRSAGLGVDVVTGVVVAACGAVVVSIVAGWTITPRLIAAQALLPVVGGLAVVAAAVAAFRRRWAVLAIGSAVALWAVGMVAPTALAETRPGWSSSASTLTVYSANLRRTNTTPELAFAAALDADAEVVVFVEYATAFEPVLRSSGLLERYPTVVRDESGDRGLVLTRLPVRASGTVTEAGFSMPTVTVAVDGTEVFIAGIHTLAPAQLDYVERWTDQVPAVARVVDGHRNAIAVGDFNSSLWNPPMRQLLDWGFTDAHDATGNGLARTWGPAPTGTTARLPILGIDHALSRGPDLVPLSVAEAAIPGSDHRSIEVTYAVR